MQGHLPRVLLVHGLLNAAGWLRPLAARLKAQGFDAELFGYSSLLDGPQRAVPRLIERLRRDHVDAIVGHSLGGLIALEALREGRFERESGSGVESRAV